MRWWIALAALSVGCAHTPRGHIEAVAGGADRICAGDVCYRVGPLDDKWRLVHQKGTSAGWYSDALGGVISANATCRDDAEAAPLTTLTHQLLIGYTDRRIESQVRVPLDRREALRTRVEARLDGVPMTLDMFVLKRNGCIFDLSYAAPPGSFARGSDDFQRFVDGFADVREATAARGGS